MQEIQLDFLGYSVHAMQKYLMELGFVKGVTSFSTNINRKKGEQLMVFLQQVYGLYFTKICLVSTI